MVNNLIFLLSKQLDFIMKWIFFFIVLVHALIHLLGFFKAFQLAEINQLTQHISKPMGILWLFAFILFLAAAIQFIINHNLWWITGLAAVILSQILIILFWTGCKVWNDTKHYNTSCCNSCLFGLVI